MAWTNSDFNERPETPVNALGKKFCDLAAYEHAKSEVQPIRDTIGTARTVEGLAKDAFFLVSLATMTPAGLAGAVGIRLVPELASPAINKIADWRANKIESAYQEKYAGLSPQGCAVEFLQAVRGTTSESKQAAIVALKNEKGLQALGVNAAATLGVDPRNVQGAVPAYSLPTASERRAFDMNARP